ncbi:MAG: SDR family oxidoreductase [Deltaproteobacteria bacterium]|nr:SDR family oxidoreductase [Deltaproteobacteria bacterium]
MSERPWVLVLGCTVGAGGAICRRFLETSRANIIGVHRGNFPEEAAALMAIAEATGTRCVLLVGDAGRLDNIAGLTEQVTAILNGDQLDMVVHSCADGSSGLVVCDDPKIQLHPKQVLKTFEIMAHSFLFWGQALVNAGLMRRGGQLLALPNTMDELVARGFCAIGASKAALVAYIKYMANELGRLGVRTNGLRFGATPTAAFQRMPTHEATLAAIVDTNPMGRHTTVEDVADFVELLLDPRAAWLNGAVIDFDGGEHFTLGDRLFGLKP